VRPRAEARRAGWGPPVARRRGCRAPGPAKDCAAATRHSSAGISRPPSASSPPTSRPMTTLGWWGIRSIAGSMASHACGGHDGGFEDVRYEVDEFTSVSDCVLVAAPRSGRGTASGVRVEERWYHVWGMRRDEPCGFASSSQNRTPSAQPDSRRSISRTNPTGPSRRARWCGSIPSSIPITRTQRNSRPLRHRAAISQMPATSGHHLTWE
jgi:hypothetical protein